MRKFRKCCLRPESFLRNRITVPLLLVISMLVVSPAAAIDFDVKGTTVTVGGYLKLMAIYDTDGRVDTGPFDGDLIGGYDPVLDGNAEAEKNDFRMTARESRLFVKTKSNVDGFVIKTHFEGDFYGGSDVDSETWSSSNSYRLRHAYGSFAKDSHEITAGQTWSTFMDLAAGVPDMDLAGDPGFTFVRQAQLRYQYNLRPGHYIAAAIENPDAGLRVPPWFVNNTPATVTSEETMPDVVVKYFYATKTFTVSPRVIFRQFDLTDTTLNKGGSASAWGAALSGSFKIGPARLVATVMKGDGLGRYGGLGNFAGAGLTATGKIETVEFTSVNGGVTFSLSDAVKWSVGAGWAENDDEAFTGTDAILTGAATKTAKGYHTNVKWAITPSLEWAIGVGRYEREVMNGTEGDQTRYQSYFKFDF